METSSLPRDGGSPLQLGKLLTRVPQTWKRGAENVVLQTGEVGRVGTASCRSSNARRQTKEFEKEMEREPSPGI
jgi:hypothetical protein